MITKEKNFLEEEKINSLIHGIGSLLSIIGVYFLIFYANNSGDSYKIIGCSIYGFTLILLYLASTFFHGAQDTKIKQILEKVDHSCVFLLIAGTFTPVFMIVLHKSMGWKMFIVIWLMALIGIIYKIFFLGRFEKTSLLFYLIMGWTSVVSIKEIIENTSFIGVLLFFIGGLFYTFGTIFYALDKRPYFHQIWHVMVLFGSISHYFMILNYVMPLK